MTVNTWVETQTKWSELWSTNYRDKKAKLDLNPYINLR